ncbi:IS607 family transposase [Cyanobacterium aponinum UTEX 3221]|uniref:IS607 family transposase n=1 Tax=Cyanobacterium aponinum TaxID=379064 RepID=UPI002B4C03F1|nr:IS607 family transposase [Cyanobacterium aponinum]WRL38276.1 IS607 family transposase [Cyanobacterium aponinum UTEX 3221]WRL38524.1 IS607 family transposase [Cyanobacterium aponinum UTEX 3221]WRL38695.1 IS607 family transposase [Cyanobacterium aponinum UTEX 3221]WRL39177.1 IS607 family transposase [Cyanobacterium aponinum UTEX 3221]WRL39288.1 IS607 family transposase [Cyanobacterium aponinum UTEX 3221]
MPKKPEYVTPAQAAKTLGVSTQTLRNWDKTGKIKVIRTPTGLRRYDLSSIVGDAQGTTVIYARVSSYKQREDLDRQADYLQSLYPEAEVIKEIGSGLNYRRQKLKTLLERILSGNVQRLVVAHKDRLARFGFDLFKFLCELNSCELVVCNNSSLSPEREMVEDILAIVHVFSCRLYGLRKYKKQIKEDTSLSSEGA